MNLPKHSRISSKDNVSPEAPWMEEIVYVYRGIRAGHPNLTPALHGIVLPGDLHGTISAEDHNAGVADDLARSPFTSWTHRLSFARKIAETPPGGVILRLPFLPQEGSGWAWVYSPDAHNEDEELLRGIRMDAEVMS